MQLKVKKLSANAMIPTRTHPTDGGLDITATSYQRTDQYVEYGTGLAVSIPKGFVGLLFPRSSVSDKDLTLSNSCGIIDAGYQGEIKFRFRVAPHSNNEQKFYTVGERIGQLVIVAIPETEVLEVNDFNESSDRGTGGFGSTNEKVSPPEVKHDSGQKNDKWKK